MKKIFLFAALSVVLTLSGTITVDDMKFCYSRELWDVLELYEDVVRDSLLSMEQADPVLYEILQGLSVAAADTLKIIELLEWRAIRESSLHDAIQVLKITSGSEEKTVSDLLLEKLGEYRQNIFTGEGERLMLEQAAGGISEEEMYAEMRLLPYYPELFDRYIQHYMNSIAVERDDSVRIEMIREFADNYPASRWQDMNSYYHLVSLLNLKQYSEIVGIIQSTAEISPVLSYHYAAILQNPSLRENHLEGEKSRYLLELSLSFLESAVFPAGKDLIRVMYSEWSESYWRSITSLSEAKAFYYLILSENGYYGGEEFISGLSVIDSEIFAKGWELLISNPFPDNDFGEQAEWHYWLGRFAVLSRDAMADSKAAEHFIDSLIAGSPRKRFDESAYTYLEAIHKELNVTIGVMDWSRTIKNYQGPVFQDITKEAGLSDIRYTRVAFGDYNNDGFADILFNGHKLYRNNSDLTFADTSLEAGIENHSSRGGLWADFDKDGRLDFVSLSSSDSSPGDMLYRNKGDGSFEQVNHLIGDINNYSPTEGGAWIDLEQKGYPSLYMANYEKWQVQTGFEDNFWYNDRGRFSNKTAEWGMLTPDYTTGPGLAGRGVSPADYNNDGRQSIFVSNYRLARNFLWEIDKGSFIDKAPLHGLHGHLQSGYYGHTIGADWGDYNNNGYLDIFIANLAHPRFIEFSDISMLMRNDGVKQRLIGDSLITYHHFTDVTKEAGIAFDELHSDPNWFDTNNNGYLDLYITSVYENDRSYLYLNNEDGTFTDISWLSGTRVYNGWGNAVADVNNNGRLDLLVGSGNGVRLFLNVTANDYKSQSFKPYWDGDEVKIAAKSEWSDSYPNTPAIGSRIRVIVEYEDGTRQSLIRELNGGKGTTSQNDQFLHFGLKEGTIVSVELVTFKAE